MTVEVATYISQFDASLPTSTDPRSEGDNHLRLLKLVLQNSFPGIIRPVYLNGGALSKTADYTVVAADGGKTIHVAPAAANVTITLPVLAADQAGWWVEVVKTNTSFICKVAGGGANILRSNNLTLTTVRCNIPLFRYRFEWSGTVWLGSRPNNLPVGALIEYTSSVLPPGYEWPNGQVLASVAADYPEYNAAMGSGITVDLRGRVGVTLDNLGGAAAGRLGAIITGTALGSTGGTETVTLAANQIPSITSSNAAQSITITGIASAAGRKIGGPTNPAESVTSATVSTAGGGAVAAQGAVNGAWSNITDIQGTSNNAISVTSNNTGGLAHSNLQPSIILSKLLIVE